MSGRLLDFSQYLGGADNVVTIETFPGSTKSYTYDFQDINVSQYQFSADYQSILLSEVAYDRVTGLPNFSTTIVSGYFDNYDTVGVNNFDTGQAAAGLVSFLIPANRYTGNIFPSARQNVVATVVGFEWVTLNNEKHVHRYLLLERWEPGVPMGDPRENVTPAFIAL